MRAPGAGTRPLVIVCPGGGYGHHAAHEGIPVAAWLNRIGLHAAVLGYRVAPHRHPAPLLDAQRAIRLVRRRAAELEADPERVAILGFSAGGHLACSAAVLHGLALPHPDDGLAGISPRPDAFVACYPVVSFGAWRHDGSLRNLLGADPSAELVQRLSLERGVDAETPPGFIWHTAEDAAVPVENSLHLAGAMSRAGVPFALHVFPKGRHGIGMGEGFAAAAWTGLAEGWFRDLGWI
jgi:acetyl esterase/lipase